MTDSGVTRPTQVVPPEATRPVIPPVQATRPVNAVTGPTVTYQTVSQPEAPSISVNASLKIGVAYLAAITVAEVLTVLIEPRIGLVLHSGLLITLLLHAALTWDQPLHRLLLCITLAPLIRLLSLALPLANFPQIYWYLITSLPLLVAAFSIVRTLKIRRQQIGFTAGFLPLQLLIGLTGFVLGYMEYLILQPAPLITELNIQQFWLPALILLVNTGFTEEFLFRGLIQQTARETLGRFGIVYVALIFAVLHIGYRSITDVLFVLAVGLFFGWIVNMTGSISGVTLSHGLTNITLFLIAPFLLIDSSPVPPSSALPLDTATVMPLASATSNAPLVFEGITTEIPIPTATAATTSTPMPTDTPPPTDPPTPTTIPSLRPMATPAPAQNDLGILPTNAPTTSPEEGDQTILLPSPSVSIMGSLPHTATVTATASTEAATTLSPCSPPDNWVAYIIQSGDTLFRIALRAGISHTELQQINCIDDARLIKPGQVIHIPPAATTCTQTASLTSTTEAAIPPLAGCQLPSVRIEAPLPDTILTERFPVLGTAATDDPATFNFYRVDLRREDETETRIIDLAFSPIVGPGNTLAIIDPVEFGRGTYQIILTVENTANTVSGSCAVRVYFR